MSLEEPRRRERRERGGKEEEFREALRQLRKQTSRPPVLVVAGHTAKTEELLEAGADGVVARPFHEDDLRWAVARLAARRRRQVSKMELSARKGSPRRSHSNKRYPSPPKIGLVPYTRFDSPLKTTREHVPVLHGQQERHHSPLKTSRTHRDAQPLPGFGAIYDYGG